MIIYLVVLIFSVPVKGQENYFYSKVLKDSILRDTIYLYDSITRKPKDLITINQIKDLAKSIETDEGVKSKMFPYSGYDSVVAYRFNKDIPPCLENENSEDSIVKIPVELFKNGKLRTDLKYPTGTKLTSLQVNRLLTFINDTRNFGFGYIACANFSVGLIVFYSKGKRISYIEFDSVHMFYCYPKNKRIQDGLLTERGYSIISLLDKIGFKMKK